MSKSMTSKDGSDPSVKRSTIVSGKKEKSKLDLLILNQKKTKSICKTAAILEILLYC